MIRLRRSVTRGLEGDFPPIDAVRDALQLAIELEHSTIPLYLYAMYSLDPEKNAEIVQLIQSIVVEEMLHMVLSANALNALGGSPEIAKPGFVPQYPGHLPGGVESGLTVHLRPFSMEHLDEFIDIEQPEEPQEYGTEAAVEDSVTIGDFYAKIIASIERLGDRAFASEPRNQVPPDLMDGAIVVNNVASAKAALSTIVRQGEGTTTSPLEGRDGSLAHYYRFMEIKKGHLLVPVPHATSPKKAYSYTGEVIPFDPDGVYPVPADPKSSGFPNGYLPGSAQQRMNDLFNYTYTGLLSVLHVFLNGDATADQFNAALGIMMSLKSQAKAMSSGIPNPDVIAGPTFEYQPFSP